MYGSTPTLKQMPEGLKTVEIRIRGTVQGVGFRPAVWRLANENDLVGYVLNDGQGVFIRTTGEQRGIDRFLTSLEADPPPLSLIESIEIHSLDRVEPFDGFDIAESVGGKARTNVAADAATCPACWAEVLDPRERRHRYPFTNCTHCGPRLSIVTGVPYDRAQTTMSVFPMCADCAAEYRDPADRRFHAQPIACPACGPKVWLDALGGSSFPVAGGAALDQAVHLLKQGAILAIRGLGGFNLACDATDQAAVSRLRARKRRAGKPFALMVRDRSVIERFASLSQTESELLHSSAAPIVLLRANGRQRLPDAVAPGLRTLGFMLPYTPLHKLILEEFDGPLVMTSGNIAHEPQIIDNAQARSELGGIADAGLFHDREIANRVDDSVVRVMGGRARMLRRARGHAPKPVALPKSFARAPEILAFGGELKSTFCLIKDGAFILSQHQGDLENDVTFDDYRKNMALYAELYQCRPRIFAADAHPDYLSSKLARRRAEEEAAKLHEVQHHHAHIASALAENGRELDAPAVLGVVLDGLGFGADGTIWGGEFLRADYRGFTRLAALKPVAMIGGAQAMREPWRNTYAHLEAAFGLDRFLQDFGALDLAGYLAGKPRPLIDRMLAGGVNVPPASSCGRLFDAVAAALGHCPDIALFEGQGAMELEDLVDGEARAAAEALGGYSFARALSPSGLEILDPAPMWRGLLEDLRAGTPAGVMSARFHLGLAWAVADLAVALARESDGGPLDTVVLSGGCFQNKLLFETCVARVETSGLNCLGQSQVPMNDGGIALGQAAIAAAREIDGGSAACV